MLAMRLLVLGHCAVRASGRWEIPTTRGPWADGCDADCVREWRELAAQRSSLGNAGRPQLLVAVGTTNWLDLVSNWVASVESVGCTNYVLLGTDDVIVQSLRKVGLPMFRHALMPASTHVTHLGVRFRAALWMRRWQRIAQLVERGFDVLHSDLDAVMMINPFTAQLAPELERADVVASHGTSHEDWLVCMGWLWLRSTEVVRRQL
jgi:hypothetical protein